jgi:predicted dinucleotide-binding enzyme
MKLGFIGIGPGGSTLANAYSGLGHEIVVGARNPHSDSVRAACRWTPRFEVTSIEEAIDRAEVLFLVVPFEAAIDDVAPRYRQQLREKIVIDCTNPFRTGDDGYYHGLLGGRESGTAQLQRLLPETSLVKAFSMYGYEHFRYPQHGRDDRPDEPRPVMLYCGNRPLAKRAVHCLIGQMGWNAVDAGDLDAAQHIEHMTLLWLNMVHPPPSINQCPRPSRRQKDFLWAMLGDLEESEWN